MRSTRVSSSMRARVAMGAFGAAVALAGTAHAIVKGATSTSDVAVVMLLAYAPGADPFAGAQPVKSCTATLVSPHVLATAAHCTGGDFPSKGAGYTYWVFAGADVTAPSPKLLEVTSVTFDPSYVKGSHDVAVAILAKPLDGVTPIPMNRAALDATW